MRIHTALAALGLAVPFLGQAACKVESLELPVRMVGSRAVATVGINGTDVPLTVDSGAFFSILTDAAAAQLNLPLKRNSALRVEGITGRIDTKATTVDKLRLFKGEIDHVQFVVGGNEPGAGTMGLLGRNILAYTDTEYDLAHGVIRFLYPNDDCAKSSMAYWAGSSPVSAFEAITRVQDRTPAIRAKVRLNGKEFTALFDTGATTLISAYAARRAGSPEAEWTPAATVYGGGRGSAKGYIAPFDTFEIGGELIRNNRLRVADFELGDADLLLGIDFFLSHRIYVSKSQSTIFMTYNGGQVFFSNRSDPASATAAGAASADTPTTADEFARRGAASASRRDFEGALADLDRACELAPTSAAYFAQRGTVLQALKRPVRALEDFDKALALDPAEPDARLQRAALRFNAKDLAGAKTDLAALDKSLAPQAQMRLPLSQLYLILDQPADALAQLDQWIPAHPNELMREGAYNSRCRARLMLGLELDKALDDCDTAVDRAAKNPAFLDNRGWVLLKLGKDRKALADFDLAIEIRPANASSLYGRGLVKTRLGDAAQGETDLAAARKLEPDIDARLARIGLIPQPAEQP